MKIQSSHLHVLRNSWKHFKKINHARISYKRFDKISVFIIGIELHFILQSYQFFLPEYMFNLQV